MNVYSLPQLGSVCSSIVYVNNTITHHSYRTGPCPITEVRIRRRIYYDKNKIGDFTGKAIPIEAWTGP